MGWSWRTSTCWSWTAAHPASSAGETKTPTSLGVVCHLFGQRPDVDSPTSKQQDALSARQRQQDTCFSLLV
jgi:hypothetical protein